MRLVYPLLWSRLGRQADRAQAVETAAALARAGVDITLLMPRGAEDPALDAEAVRAWFGVSGDFRLVQRPSRWAGETIGPSAMWLRQVFRDEETARADVLYSRTPMMLAIGDASPLPFATDHYRPWPDQWPLIRPLIRRTARHPRCLGFVLHSDYAAQSFARLPVDPAKLLVAHNGADPAAMLPRLGKAEARAKLGLDSDRPIVVYAGRINARKGLDQVLAMAASRPGILFLLVGSEGDGPIERAAALLGNVWVFPWQTSEALAPFLYAADILLIPPSRAPLERFGNCVLPIKTFAYLAAGRPILAPASPDTAELLRYENNALLVPPDRPELAAAAIDRLIAEPVLAARLSVNAETLAAGLSWDARAAKIANFLEKRLSGLR